MTNVASWGVSEVCDALSARGLSAAVVSAFRTNCVDGATLLALEKAELKDELDIAALQDRKRAWEAVGAIKALKESSLPAVPAAAPATPMSSTASPVSPARPRSSDSASPETVAVGQEVIYRSRSRPSTPAKVVHVDHSVSPAAYTVRFSDGTERGTEICNLSTSRAPGTSPRSILRRNSQPTPSQSSNALSSVDSTADTSRVSPRPSASTATAATGVSAPFVPSLPHKDASPLRKSTERATSPAMETQERERAALEALERELLGATAEARSITIPSPIDHRSHSSHRSAIIQSQLAQPPSRLRGSPPAAGESPLSDVLDSRTKCVNGKVDYRAIQEQQMQAEEQNERKFQEYETMMKRNSFK